MKSETIIKIIKTISKRLGDGRLNDPHSRKGAQMSLNYCAEALEEYFKNGRN